MARLLAEVRACRACVGELPLGARPVLQADPRARLLLASQAPGRRVHETGLPFNDVSGDRLRLWLGLSREVFYDAGRVAIVPMAFCYPGKGRGGDLPPPPICAQRWRQPLLEGLERLQLTIVIGRHALLWHAPQAARESLAEVVRSSAQRWPQLVVLPHPSPRNNRWLARHPWFEAEILPPLRARVQQLLAQPVHRASADRGCASNAPGGGRAA